MVGRTIWSDPWSDQIPRPQISHVVAFPDSVLNLGMWGPRVPVVISSGWGPTKGPTYGQTLWSKAKVRRVMVNLTMGRLDHHNTEDGLPSLPS